MGCGASSHPSPQPSKSKPSKVAPAAEQPPPRDKQEDKKTPVVPPVVTPSTPGRTPSGNSSTGKQYYGTAYSAALPQNQQRQDSKSSSQPEGREEKVLEKVPEKAAKPEEKAAEDEDDEFEKELQSEMKNAANDKERQQLSKAGLIHRMLREDMKSGKLEESMRPPTTEEEANAMLAEREAKRVANKRLVSEQLKNAIAAEKEELAAGKEPLQKRVPPVKWAMTVSQWNGYIDSCKETDELKSLQATREDPDRPKTRDGISTGWVNMYDLNQMFVKPQTKGAGAGIALLLNREEPQEAQVMISHAWGEGVEECQQSLVNICIPETTTIWFCVFANYQAGEEPGDVGPDIAWQLSLNPFQQVINHEKLVAMIVVHTTQAEVYDRLWCVHEIDAALQCKLNPWAACSMQYSEGKASSCQPLAGANQDAVAIDCSQARCGRPEDEKMLREIVEANGGFDRLNKEIVDFRVSMVEYNQMVGMFAFLAGPMLITSSLEYIWRDPKRFSPADLQLFIGILPKLMEESHRKNQEKDAEKQPAKKSKLPEP